eukprot:732796-Pelagomonas_calceolata.AAC.2
MAQGRAPLLGIYNDIKCKRPQKLNQRCTVLSSCARTVRTGTPVRIHGMRISVPQHSVLLSAESMPSSAAFHASKLGPGGVSPRQCDGFEGSWFMVLHLFAFVLQEMRWGLARGSYGARQGGQTVQGCALLKCYEDEWPALIITPSSLRQQWYLALQQVRHTEGSIKEVIEGQWGTERGEEGKREILLPQAAVVPGLAAGAAHRKEIKKRRWGVSKALKGGRKGLVKSSSLGQQWCLALLQVWHTKGM